VATDVSVGVAAVVVNKLAEGSPASELMKLDGVFACSTACI